MSKHKIKTQNRSVAINKNAARVRALAEKVGELGNELGSVRKELKDELEALEDEFTDCDERTNRRLYLLERSTWRKIMDKLKDKTKRGDPASPNHRAVIMDPATVRSRPKSEDKKEDDGKKKDQEDG